MKRWFFLTLTLLLALAAYPSVATASGTITGTLTSPTTSVPIGNATLTLTLSQAGVDVSNTYALAATPVTCGTAGNGSVVGILDPLLAPSAVAINGGGSLAGTYYIKIAYVDIGGQATAAGPVLTLSVVGPNNAITVNAPALHPFGAVGYRVYIGAALGGEYFQADSVAWASVTKTSLLSGSFSGANMTDCTLTFNDAIIPSSTSYYVSAVDQRGVTIPGYPQNWYLNGTTVNIATLLPVAGSTPRWPTPIQATPPSSYATQSINSPLTLNGHTLTAGAITTTGTLTLTGNETISGTLNVTGTTTLGTVSAGAVTATSVVVPASTVYKTAVMTGGNATVTTEQDLTGATVSLDKNGKWLVTATFDLDINASGAATAFSGYLNYDGSNQTGVAIYGFTTTGTEAATQLTRQWIVTVTGQPKTAKLRAIRLSGAGTVTVFQTNTQLVAVYLGS